jgi:hypothetical protein
MSTAADQPANSRKYWVNTVSREHVQRGVVGGFTQADHGRNTRLKRLRPGDRIVFYSPRTAYPDGEPLQQFTAIGTVTGPEPYQVTMTEDFHPWRLEVRFDECQPTGIRPLLPELGFLRDQRSWGYVFRRGLFTIDEADFAIIADAMGVRASERPAQAEGAERTAEAGPASS